MTDYTTKKTAELRRDWCERVDFSVLPNGLVSNKKTGPLFYLDSIKAWELAGFVLDEMARRGWLARVVTCEENGKLRNTVQFFLIRPGKALSGEGGLDPAIDRAALIASLRALDAEEESNG